MLKFLYLIFILHHYLFFFCISMKNEASLCLFYFLYKLLPNENFIACAAVYLLNFA